MLLKRKLRSCCLSTLWLLLSMFFASRMEAQTFTLSVQRTSLEKVFQQIEQLSDYRFIYTEELISQSVPVTFSVRNAGLDSVLQICFREQPLTYITEGKHIIIRKKLNDPSAPASRTLRGKVVNETGEPVAGVTLTIKNTKLISSSDLNGEFSFTNPPLAAIIMVSGAEIEGQEIIPGSQPYVFISVKTKTSQLDETIVIAYGKTTRRTSTGTVQKVTREELNNQPINNVLAGMEGRVTGLQISQTSGLPGSNFTVRLRGQNSIANGNDPLYIIDGVPFPSITLTTAIGGGGGANTSPLSAVNPHDIESVEILKDADATAIYGSRGANGVILITTRKAKTGQTTFNAKMFSGWGKVTRLLPMLGLDDYLAMRREAFRNDGTIPTVSNARDLKLWDTTRYTDWQKMLIGNSMHTTDVNLGVSAGSGQTQIYLSGGYHKESTIIPGPFGEEKVSMSVNVSHLSTNHRLRISFGGSYLKNNTLLPREDITTSISLSPNAPKVYNEAGKYNWEGSTWVNPIAILERKYRTTTGNLLSNLNFSYNILKGFDARINLGFSSLAMREHATTPSISNDPGLLFASNASFGTNQIETFIAEPQLEYKFKTRWGNLQLLGGATIQGTDQKVLVQSGTGYQSDDLLKSLSAAAVISTLTDQISKHRYAGLFARVGYERAGKYFLTLNARRDGSSRYGPSNRFANFGSVGTSWIFSKEKFLAASGLLSFGKLKFSFGVTGNDQIGDYRFLDIYTPYSYSYQGISTLNPVQLYNPSFAWEKVTKKEASIELGFLKDRILFTVNHYNNVTGNQLIEYPLPVVTGFSGILKNLPARIRNYGWEFELNSVIIRRKNLQWSAEFSLTFPRNKLLEFEGLSSSSYANTYVIGQSLSISRRLTYAGVDTLTGNYTFLDVNGDGRISSPADLSSVVYVGQQFFGGLENIIRFRNFKLGCFAQFVRVKNASSYIARFNRPGSMNNMPEYVLERWQYPGQTADLQKFSNSNTASNSAFTNFRNSNKAFVNGSFIRLKNVYANYDLPSNLLQKIHLKAASVFIQAQNLITITSYKGLDPETKEVVPPLKVITAGIHLSF